MSTPTFVQSVNGSVTGALSSTTLAITGTTAGNRLIVYVEINGNPSSVISVSDNVNGSYTNCTPTNTGGHNGLVIASKGGIAGGNVTITASTSTTQDFRVTIEEWSNTGAPDQSAVGTSSSNGTALSSGATGALAVSGELVVCYGYVASAQNFTVGSGFTADPNMPLTSTVRLAENMIASGTGAVTGTFTINGSNSWDCIVATFQPLAAAAANNGSMMLLGVGT